MLLTISIIERHEKTNKRLNKTNEQKEERTWKNVDSSRMSNLLLLLWLTMISCEKIKAMDTLKYRNIEKKPAISDFVSSERSDTTWGERKLLINELTPSDFTVFFLDASLLSYPDLTTTTLTPPMPQWDRIWLQEIRPVWWQSCFRQ